MSWVYLKNEKTGSREDAVREPDTRQSPIGTSARDGRRRRAVLRQLAILLVGPPNLEFVEQERRPDHGYGHGASEVAHQRIVHGGHDIAAEGAQVEIAEDSPSNQLLVPILYVHAVEQTRAAIVEGRNGVAVGPVHLAAHVDQLL